jgi:hypothetical protein
MPALYRVFGRCQHKDANTAGGVAVPRDNCPYPQIDRSFVLFELGKVAAFKFCQRLIAICLTARASYLPDLTTRFEDPCLPVLNNVNANKLFHD